MMLLHSFTVKRCYCVLKCVNVCELKMMSFNSIIECIFVSIN